MIEEQALARPTAGKLAARGIAGGLAAGAAFLAVTMWFATSVGDPAKAPLLMMSTLVEGDQAMMTGEASAATGLAVHLGLSAAFGLVFSILASRLRTNGAIAVAGTAFGLLLYLLNFKVLAPAAFTVFEMANDPFELVVHMVFGTLLSLAFFTWPQRQPVAASTGRRAESRLADRTA